MCVAGEKRGAARGEAYRWGRRCSSALPREPRRLAEEEHAWVIEREFNTAAVARTRVAKLGAARNKKLSGAEASEQPSQQANPMNRFKKN